jgi:BirA family biotin operon repressor/biotin-[acetyl-CoA-carboxylase] ligase
VSLVLRELDERHALLPLTAAVAICRALEPLPCLIKWPNDIWVERQKLAGILVEGRPQEGWAVLGIGLNVTTSERQFAPELRGAATSLRMAGSALERDEVLERLLGELAEWISAPAERVLAAWRERDALRGERVRWAGGEGSAAGVDAAGGLLVDTPAGRVTLDAGEVHLSR